MKMDLQADMNWIISELKNVKDPDLIQAFKNMLKDRNKQYQRANTDQYNSEVKEAEEKISKGEFVTHEQMLKELDRW